MATKRAPRTRAKSTSKKKSPRRKKKASRPRPPVPTESVVARVWQVAILVPGLLLLFSALVSPRAGPVMVGALLLGSAFPPVRGVVDEWLTGKRRGKVAEQAAAIRMTIGAVLILFTLLTALTHL